ncbi:MAG: MBL fold metallo-hydrolase [Labilithrix sp.]|nr:MBL fold metallo-hydrolase [Labilithrix sp.]MCW5817781.1 MBL fold metallo-hydrolase [Labilithrix sp.]
MSRRKLALGAAGAAAAAVAAEWWTFQGHLDHRRSPGAATPKLSAPAADGVVHVGHSTHVIQLGGKKLLTDPWFYDPAFGALSHAVAPAVRPADLDPVDAILISHDHADHADLRALAEIAAHSRSAAVLVATEHLAESLRAIGFTDVSVLAKDAERELPGAIAVRAVEAVHDVYEVGFVVRHAGRCVYFAGDTALHGSMEAIGKSFRPDVAILPCDGTRVLGGALHVMRPEDAVEAARRLGAKVIVPSHAEAYFSDPLAATVLASMEKDAIQRLHDGIAKHLPGVRCATPEPGEHVPI